LTWLFAGVDTVPSDLSVDLARFSFCAAFPALLPTVPHAFEPFDQEAFQSDRRARPTTVTSLTVDRCGTGVLTRAGARMACELTRNKRDTGHIPPPTKEKKLALPCSA